MKTLLLNVAHRAVRFMVSPARACVRGIGALALGAALISRAAPIEITPEDVAAGYAKHHLLVKFRDREERLLSQEGKVTSLATLVSDLGLGAGAWLEEPAVFRLLQERQSAVPAGAAAPGGTSTPFYYLHLPPGLEVAESLKLLQSHPRIEYAEPDHVGEMFGVTPNDTGLSWQWHHINLSSSNAWEITQGSTNVIVALLDTGIDLTNEWFQPEFAGRLLPGYNFVDGTTDVQDLRPDRHGTAVAAIIGANANNHYYGAGIDWNCRLLPLKVVTYYDLLESSVAQAVDYAVAQGAKVIHFPGGAEQDHGVTLGRAIDNAIAHGAIFVCAAGNSGTGPLAFPARYAPTIAVGAADGSRRWIQNNYGPELDLLAPGIWVDAGVINGASGTSYAGAMVAGVSSLLASVRPSLTQEQAVTLLGAGAEDQLGDAPGRLGGDGTDTPGWDKYHGWGRVNAYFSVLLATTRIDQVEPLPGGRLELSWKSPINASTNRPYRVEFTTPLTNAWTRVTNGVFRYEGYRTWWTEPDPPPAPNAERFYRVRVVLE